ncbi:hypothetical protein [uncultured Allofournierella sp.]|uniref:hypothetical protein n=1 Tax=uncultured Allofournierella sp. TaxID=1940258 RepID=UPI0025DAFB0A|nr:hypothetical protein [uncultured Fournierella sp.]
MGKKIICALAAFAVLAGLCFVLGYTRPMTLEQLCPGIRLEDCRAIQASFRRGQTGEEITLTLQNGDTAFAQVTELMEKASFRRSLLSLFPLGGKSHALQPEDFKWLLLLEFGDTQLPDGTQGSGMLIELNDFYGTLEVSYVGETWRCSVSNQEEWRSAVMECLETANKKEGNA